MVKNLLAVRETWVRSLGQEDPLEKEMATHSSVFAWEIPWTEGPGSYSPCGTKEDAAAVAAKSLQSCPTLCDPMDCSLPDSSDHGIL